MSRNSQDRKPLWQILLILVNWILVVYALWNCFQNCNVGLWVVYLVGAMIIVTMLDTIIDSRITWYITWFVFALICVWSSSVVFSCRDFQSSDGTEYVCEGQSTLDGSFYNVWPFGGQVGAVKIQLSTETSIWHQGLTADSVMVAYKINSVARLDTTNLRETIIQIGKNYGRQKLHLIHVYEGYVNEEADKTISRLTAEQLFKSIIMPGDSANPQLTANVNQTTIHIDPGEPQSDMVMLHNLGYRHQGIDLVGIHRK